MDANCPCCRGDETFQRNRPITFHRDAQDTDCEGWKQLLELVEQAAREHWPTFAPGQHMLPEHWSQIVELPTSISKLKNVQELMLYGSHLVRIPPEIGEMSNLVEFVPYTSTRLHWFTYEITRCPLLAKSTVSTRRLYGNYKYRSPFPKLEDGKPGTASPGVTSACSICSRPADAAMMKFVWTSQRVATDVLPLLVNACSDECIRRIPPSPDDYVSKPHRGGLDVAQPPRRF